eukprot:2977880-Pyramimonas_sp.AAC.1
MGWGCAAQVAAQSACDHEKHHDVLKHAHILEMSWARYLDDGLFVWAGSLDAPCSFEAHLNAPCATP